MLLALALHVSINRISLFCVVSTGKHFSRSGAVRARVGHPIIDSDGHVVEFEPALLDYIRDAGGSAILERYKKDFPTIAKNASLSRPDL